MAIDALPLDLFGDDEDRSTTEPAGEAATVDQPPLHCQLCGAAHAPDVAVCPACGRRSEADPPAELPTRAGRLECQWCDAQLQPEMTTCPRCGAAVANPTLEVPGLTHPLPGSVEDGHEGRGQFVPRPETSGVEGIAAEIIVSVVKSLLLRRG